MHTDNCVAMVLAGGRGERLGALTQYYSKPAIPFGAGNRIIDFTLDNCRHSGLHTVGVLSQYFSDNLSAYVSAAYSGGRERGRFHILPPPKGTQYLATADAVYKNIAFIERFRPKHVLILAGDHVYRMNYAELTASHDKTGADVTVASTRVPVQDAHRYGILNAYPDGRIYSFEEKPRRPKSGLASMGIYVFRWDALKKYLLEDSWNTFSRHDFGKDIIPVMLSTGASAYTYRFDGYWRDVGTLDSLWEANMDQLADPPEFQIPGNEPDSMGIAPYFLAAGSQMDRSIISGGCSIFGNVRHSVLADSVTVERGAEVVDSVIMPGAYIGENAKIYKAIVGPEAKIMHGAEIGTDGGLDVFVDRNLCRRDISLVAPWVLVPQGMRFQKSSQISMARLQAWADVLQVAVPNYRSRHSLYSKHYGA